MSRGGAAAAVRGRRGWWGAHSAGEPRPCSGAWGDASRRIPSSGEGSGRGPPPRAPGCRVRPVGGGPWGLSAGGEVAGRGLR